MVFAWITDLVGIVFNPILVLPPLYAMIILAFLISLFITLIYKFTTNQKLMKDLKDQIKELQTELKTLKDDPKKMMDVQKQAMETNMKYMMHSMRPTLFTFLPIILIFGWLQASFAVGPLMPNEPFDIIAQFDEGTTGSINIRIPDSLILQSESTQAITNDLATWTINPEKEGLYTIAFDYKDRSYGKDVEITQKQMYEPISKSIDVDGFNSINVKHNELKLLNLFGWKLGWLGTYIIFSIIFSMVLRKIMKIY